MMTETQALVGFLCSVAFIAGVLVSAWFGAETVRLVTAQRDAARKALLKANERAAEATVAAASARAQVEWHGGRR